LRQGGGVREGRKSRPFGESKRHRARELAGDAVMHKSSGGGESPRKISLVRKGLRKKREESYRPETIRNRQSGWAKPHVGQSSRQLGTGRKRGDIWQVGPLPGRDKQLLIDSKQSTRARGGRARRAGHQGLFRRQGSDQLQHAGRIAATLKVSEGRKKRL